MSGLTTPPTNYLAYNSQQSKRLAVVVDIPGLDYLTSTTIGRKIVYGDPYNYGDAGLIYDGIRAVGSVAGERSQRVLLNLDGGSLTISQKLEPEQGRASISTLQMTFIDKDQYMTQACSPGILIDDILGKEVKIWLGYAQTSFPDDYYLVWRGRVAQTVPEIGRVTLQFVDPSIIRRQQIFSMGQSSLTSDITNVATTIPIVSNGDFAKKILGPDGSTYDTNVRCYVKIDDEFIEYQQAGSEGTGFGTNQFLGAVRGSRGSVAAAHTAAAQADGFVELSGHAIDLALKIMLSGWGAPYLENQSLFGFVTTSDATNPSVSNGLVLPQSTDAVRDLGVTVGDFITVSGASTPGNNGVCTVTGFEDSLGTKNKIITTDKTFTAEQPTSAVFSIRSQFDTLPDVCGCKMPGTEVDVAGHLYLKNTYLVDTKNAYRFLISSSNTDSGKTFIESEIMLPLGAYALTRQGKISMGITKPPIADERTTVFNNTNVIDPQSIKVTRSLNNRKYFNEIDWEYDFDDAGAAASVRKTLDADSLNLIGVSSVLPISSQGARTDLGFETIVADRELFLFLRYANASVLVDIKTNFGSGNLVEAGDVVVLQDNGLLQIPNLSTGKRDYGVQLLEVVNRSLDIKSGQVQLQLEGGIGALVTDRFATVTPSSLLVAGSTSSRIVITDSFGAIFPGQEYRKWQDYVGLKVAVHSLDYSVYEETTFIGFDPTNAYALQLSPALSFTPAAGYILDLAMYPTNTDATDQSLVKLIHAYLDPTVAVASGTSDTQFDVGAGDISKFAVGQTILVRNVDWSSESPEVTIDTIVGTLITVSSSLGFTPDNTMSVELIGFADGAGPYRLI
jgi:hypothetical protein